jgi:hypothetical protein
VKIVVVKIVVMVRGCISEDCCYNKGKYAENCCSSENCCFNEDSFGPT